MCFHQQLYFNLTYLSDNLFHYVVAKHEVQIVLTSLSHPGICRPALVLKNTSLVFGTD